MQLSSNKILVTIVILTLLAIPAIIFAPTVIRAILSLPFVLFFPGYSLLAFLFPGKDRLSTLERTVLSIGLSIAIVPLIGFVLNYTPLGIDLLPLTITVALFIIVSAVLAWYRLNKLAEDEHFSGVVNFGPAYFRQASTRDRLRSIGLTVAVIALGSYFIYLITTPLEGEFKTDFFLLDSQGETENYPTQVMVGEPVELIVSITNHEGADTSFRVVAGMMDNEVLTVSTGLITDGEEWRGEVNFLPPAAGEDQRVEFNLYLNGDTTPYYDSPLYIYIDVSTAGS